MKLTLELFNKIVIVSLLVVTGTAIGNFGREYFVKDTVKEDVVVKMEILPLKNGGEIEIAVVDGKKIVSMSYEDFKYIRKGFKKTLKNIESLFARIE